MQNTLNQVFCLVMSTDSTTFLHNFNSAHFFYKLHEVMEGPRKLRDLTGQCSFSYENKRMCCFSACTAGVQQPFSLAHWPKNVSAHQESAQHARLPV